MFPGSLHPLGCYSTLLKLSRSTVHMLPLWHFVVKYILILDIIFLGGFIAISRAKLISNSLIKFLIAGPSKKKYSLSIPEILGVYFFGIEYLFSFCFFCTKDLAWFVSHSDLQKSKAPFENIIFENPKTWTSAHARNLGSNFLLVLNKNFYRFFWFCWQRTRLYLSQTIICLNQNTL